MTVDAAALLRAKAILLLRREREVHEFRRERERMETWLHAFHRLSVNLKAVQVTGLIEQWVRAMIEDLTFEFAAVYSHYGAGRLVLSFGLAADSPASELVMSKDCEKLFAERESGLYGDEGPRELDELAAAAGLGRFYWFFTPHRDEGLLFLAGVRRGNERFHAVSPADGPHFELLGNHVAALLENTVLIAALARETGELQSSNARLDVTVQRLRDAQEKLLKSSRMLAETSRRAGMADVATGVLHNVGNALNSVNVSAEVLIDRVRFLKLPAVSRIAALLEEHAYDLPGFLQDDERGRKLVPFLAELGTHFAREREALLAEAESLLGHIDHIKAIVGKQQAYAVSFDMSHACKIDEIVEDALELVKTSITRHGIEVIREHEPLPEMLLDRHKILQILVNFLQNAKDSLTLADRPEKHIWTGIECRGGRMRVAVRDDGLGIAKENQNQLFRHGFTTKPNGHGFGLHASAIAAQEMGGTVGCESDGPGRGARFVLELPMRLAFSSR